MKIYEVDFQLSLKIKLTMEVRRSAACVSCYAYSPALKRLGPNATRTTARWDVRQPTGATGSPAPAHARTTRRINENALMDGSYNTNICTY